MRGLSTGRSELIRCNEDVLVLGHAALSPRHPPPAVEWDEPYSVASPLANGRWCHEATVRGHRKRVRMVSLRREYIMLRDRYPSDDRNRFTTRFFR